MPPTAFKDELNIMIYISRERERGHLQQCNGDLGNTAGDGRRGRQPQEASVCRKSGNNSYIRRRVRGR